LAPRLADTSKLLSGMVDQLVERGRITSPQVEQAMRSVPRHLFLPGLNLAIAYADEAVALKWRGGRAISSISQPSMIAAMLEMLEVQPGSSILEIGTGSGYNAALLTTLAGVSGRVVTVEIEDQLATEARSHLSSGGFDMVEVHVGDGRAGWPACAPYDRIIVTASTPGPEQSWVEQLAEAGRMVVPLARELEAVVYVKIRGELEQRGTSPALFIPLR
jgi:protein-L-isoaspartate(D-aspartate) O-methyltransferase